MGVAAAGSAGTSAHPSAPPWIRPLHGTSFTSTAHRKKNRRPDEHTNLHLPHGERGVGASSSGRSSGSPSFPRTATSPGHLLLASSAVLPVPPRQGRRRGAEFAHATGTRGRQVPRRRPAASMARLMCANGSVAERSAGASAGDGGVGELHGGWDGARSGWASARYGIAAAIPCPSFLPAAIAVSRADRAREAGFGWAQEDEEVDTLNVHGWI